MQETYRSARWFSRSGPGGQKISLPLRGVGTRGSRACGAGREGLCAEPSFPPQVGRPGASCLCGEEIRF